MTSKSETIAIFGATGITGGHLVKEALKQGYQVRVMVRNPAKMKAWMETALDGTDDSKVYVVKGDVSSTDKAELEAALRDTLKDADYVISSLGGGNMKSSLYPRLFLTHFLENDLMPLLMKEEKLNSKIKAFVYTAAMFSPKPGGVSDLPWYMKILKVVSSWLGMGPQMEDHDSAVRYLDTMLEKNTSNMKIVVVRPGVLADDYSLGKPLVKSPTPYLSGKMGQQDLALCLLKTALKDSDELQGKYPFLCPDSEN